MTESTLELLLRRRSVVAKNLTSPGPDVATLELILKAASRVPDHKILTPWRFLVFDGAARETFGAILAGISCLENQDTMPDEKALEAERQRFLRAPVVLAVVSSIKDTKPVPEWEQILSAGAVCQNILIASTAQGFGAQWVTEWLAYSDRLRPVLGLAAAERIAGFVYIGTAKEPPKERARPDLGDIINYWQPPSQS